MNDTNLSNTKVRIIGCVSLLLLFVIVNSYCTQFVAGRLAYHPALGSPLFNQFYEPFAWWEWMFKFYNYAPTTYSYAFLICFGGALFSLLAMKFIVGLSSRSSRKHEGTHGTAHFATREEVMETGLMARDKSAARSGVYCGGYDDEKTGRTQYLRHDGPEHAIIIAPTQSGKGVGLVLPTLLSWPHSVFVRDIKGENYALSAGWRKTRANNTVLRYEPAEPDVGCSWNALSEIRFATRYQIADTQNIALMVIDDDGKGLSSDHFRTAAWSLLCGLILHALYKAHAVGREASLPYCAYLLSGVDLFSDEANTPTKDTGDNPKILDPLFQEMINLSLPGTIEAMEAQRFISGVGKRMSGTNSRELSGIISTANNALSLYLDPIIGENTSRCDFKVSDLMDDDHPVSLYFISTPRNMDRLKPLTRLLLTQIVLTLADRMEFDKDRSKTMHKHRLLLLVDEFPTLGKLEVFQSALGYIAGYGIKAYLIIQDTKQLYDVYGNYESIISGCHIRIAYAPNIIETAEWLSKMTGQTTIINEHVSISGKRFDLLARQFSSSFHASQRPLLTPTEIMQLPMATKNEDGTLILAPGEMLIFVAGQPVIRGRQILYFLDPTFNERSRIAPPEISDIVRKPVLNNYVVP